MQFNEVTSERENIFSSTKILQTFEINVWRDVQREAHSKIYEVQS